MSNLAKYLITKHFAAIVFLLIIIQYLFKSTIAQGYGEHQGRKNQVVVGTEPTTIQ